MVDSAINEVQWATGMCSGVNIVVCSEATFPSNNQIEGLGLGQGLGLPYNLRVN